MNHRNQVLRVGTATKLEILGAYGHSRSYGHDCARRYIFEVAEAVALEEDRERAASMVYEVADAIVGKIPLPDSLFPPAEKPKAAEPPKPKWWRRALSWAGSEWLLGFFVGFLCGSHK